MQRPPPQAALSPSTLPLVQQGGVWSASGPALPGWIAAHALPRLTKGKLCCPTRPQPHWVVGGNSHRQGSGVPGTATDPYPQWPTGTQRSRLPSWIASPGPLADWARLLSPGENQQILCPRSWGHACKVCNNLKIRGTTFAQILCYSSVSVHAFTSSHARSTSQPPFLPLPPPAVERSCRRDLSGLTALLQIPFCKMLVPWL